MPLSRDYTALDVFKAAIRDFPLTQNSMVPLLKYVLINEATDAVVGLFYDLMKNSYMSADVIVAGGATGNKLASPSTALAVTGMANNGSGLIRVTINSHGLQTGQTVAIVGTTGTTEANNTNANPYWTITVIDANTFDLQASTFSNAWISGGQVMPVGTFVTGANFTASTNTISGASMSVALSSSTHTGWLVLFEKSGNVYAGTVSQVLTTTSFVVSGNNLPSSNLTNLTNILLCATTPSGNSATLTGLRMMRTGQDIKVQLESTATSQIEFTNEQGIYTFRSGSKSNAIIFAISGDQLLLGKGLNITSYQTLTLRYPRSPIRVTQDSSPMDVPDGVAIQLVIMKLRQLIANMEKVEIPDETPRYIALVQQLYQTFGQAVASEVIEEKAKLLKG